jgi:uncharacterized protein YrrD
MSDPVSWFLIERGWAVVGPDGEKLGSVEDMLGDMNADIFNGLAVKSGLLGKVHYVPAEHVREIQDGSVGLDLGRERFDALDEHVPGAPAA